MLVFQEWLREQIEKAGGMSALARRVGVSYSTVRLWFYGASLPKPEQTERLAAGTGTDRQRLHDLVLRSRLERKPPARAAPGPNEGKARRPFAAAALALLLGGAA